MLAVATQAAPALAGKWHRHGLFEGAVDKENRVIWYNYVASFFAGMFLANAVPHFVNGICGDRFPTPFANPPGRGLSSPTINVVWGLFNLIVGYILFRVGRVSVGGDLAVALFFAGIAAMSTPMSIHFAKKHAE